MFSRFLQKFYPFKEFLRGLALIYDYIKNQLLRQVYEKDQSRLIDGDHTHKDIMLSLDARAPYPFVGCSQGPSLDETGYVCPKKIISIDGIPIQYDTWIDIPTVGNIRVSPLGCIQTDAKFIPNVVSQLDYDFYGLTPNMVLMYQFGATEERLSEYFHSIKQSTDYTWAVNQWGTIKWKTETTWGAPTKIYRDNVYIAETYLTSIPPIEDVLPPWLQLDIRIMIDLPSEITLVSTVDVHTEVVPIEETLSLSSGKLMWLKWKTGKWGSGIWDEKEYFNGAYVKC